MLQIHVVHLNSIYELSLQKFSDVTISVLRTHIKHALEDKREAVPDR